MGHQDDNITILFLVFLVLEYLCCEGAEATL
jgi:hypothetical protein